MKDEDEEVMEEIEIQTERLKTYFVIILLSLEPLHEETI